jgi:Ni/Co efflux regulator RcnB
MFKTISAALLAVSVLAAPALASPYKSADAPVIKTAPFSAKVLNANARWGRHHRHHRGHFHHRHHRHHHHWH